MILIDILTDSELLILSSGNYTVLAAVMYLMQIPIYNTAGSYAKYVPVNYGLETYSTAAAAVYCQRLNMFIISGTYEWNAGSYITSGS